MVCKGANLGMLPVITDADDGDPCGLDHGYQLLKMKNNSAIS